MGKLNLKPLADFIIAEAIEPEEQVAGGLYIPDAAREKPQQALVLAVGEGVYNLDGKRIPVEVKAGDRVLHYQHAGAPIKIGELQFLIFRPSDLLAVFTD